MKLKKLKKRIFSYGRYVKPARVHLKEAAHSLQLSINKLDKSLVSRKRHEELIMRGFNLK